jgi:predicted alpha/beta-fold hydrolase
MNKEELEREVKRAYRTFYLHPTTILNRIKSIRSMSEFANNIKVAWRLLIPW